MEEVAPRASFERNATVIDCAAPTALYITGWTPPVTTISIEPVVADEIERLLPFADDASRALRRLINRMTRLFRLRSSDMPGLICFGAVASLEAAAARAHGAAAISATGTGTDASAALAGCLAEAAELLSQFEQSGDIAIPTSPLPKLRGGWLTAALANVLRKPDWVIARHALTDEAWLAPADLCLRRDAERRAIAPVGPLSAGCAAGPTREDAALRALLELIERNAAAMWWMGGRRAPLVQGRARAAAMTLLAQLRPADSSRHTILLDLTTDLGAPVVAAASYNEDGRGFACGVAARLDPVEAARAALFEMGQMEMAAQIAALKRSDAGEAALNEIDRRNLARAAFDARDCTLLIPASTREPRVATGIPDLAALIGHLDACEVAVYLIDLTRESIEMPVVRALAPALQPFADGVTTPRLAAANAGTGGGAANGIPLY